MLFCHYIGVSDTVVYSSDSTVLAYVLKKLNEEYDYGLKLILLSVDEGITGYRDDSLEVHGKTIQINFIKTIDEPFEPQGKWCFCLN